VTARLFIVSLLAAASLAAQPATVRIGVLSLFQPHELTLRAAAAGPLRLSGGGTIEGRRGAQLSAGGDRILITIDGHASEADRVTTAGSFELSVPAKLSRQYKGGLEVTAHSGVLRAIVTMDLETAVAAAVAGETELDGPHQALLAQAVASRSYLASGGRHDGYDFCDTTHCQYLTDSLDERARSAAAETAGMLLWYDGKPFEALFTRSCDGRTRTPQEVGLPGGGPYQSVACPICARDPKTWTRTHPLTEVAVLIRERSEQARLAVVRRLGWDAVPSNSYAVTVNGDVALLTGAGEGHSIGLCQRGAAGLARQGASWRDILHRYFPAVFIR
jgi:stage II sporulation protein D